MGSSTLVDEISRLVHEALDRLRALEVRFERLENFEPRIAVLETRFANHSDELHAHRKDVTERLDRLNENIDKARASLSEWATIRKAVAWIGASFLTIATAIGTLFGWIYSNWLVHAR